MRDVVLIHESALWYIHLMNGLERDEYMLGFLHFLSIYIL